MTTLYHPHSDIVIEVPDSEIAAWTEQGWLTSDPATKTTKKTSTKSGEDN